MQWKRWLWVLFVVPLAYWISPYLLGNLLGALYAGLAVPIYSQTCLQNPVAFLNKPPFSEDYKVFLLGKNCTQEGEEGGEGARETAEKDGGGGEAMR